MKNEIEIALVARAVSGDKAAWQKIVETHERLILSRCQQILMNPEAAEDLAQEVLLQLFKKLNLFKGESKLSTWIYRMTTNQCLMYLRIVGRKPEFLYLDDEDKPPQVADEAFQTHETLETKLALEKAISALPDGYKNVLLLHDYHGYEHSEVARILGCSEGTSKSQLFKARQKMRRLLTKKANPLMRKPLEFQPVV